MLSFWVESFNKRPTSGKDLLCFKMDFRCDGISTLLITPRRWSHHVQHYTWPLVCFSDQSPLYWILFLITKPLFDLIFFQNFVMDLSGSLFGGVHDAVCLCRFSNTLWVLPRTAGFMEKLYNYNCTDVPCFSIIMKYRSCVESWLNIQILAHNSPFSVPYVVT